MPGGSRSSAERAADALGDSSDPNTADTLIGILKRLRDVGGGIIGGPVSLIDGADVAQGTTLDIAVVGDLPGTTSGKLRGLVKVLGDVWDAASHTLKISAAALPLPAGAATQATLAAVLAQLDVALSTRSTEATLAALKAVADLIKAKTDNLDTPLSGVATQATLALIKAKTDNLDVALSSRTKPGDTQPISAVALPLPPGAATDAGLAAILAALGLVAVTGPLTDAQLRATAVPVSATALPLPTGAAADASLATLHTDLSQIAAQLTIDPWFIAAAEAPFFARRA